MQELYTGPETEYTDILSKESINLKPNEKYDIEVSLDGPQISINGHDVIHPDSTIWIHFVNSNIHMPYSPQAISKHWPHILS